MIIARLTAPTQSAVLKWVKHNHGDMQLENIPTRGQAQYAVKLFQQSDDGESTLCNGKFQTWFTSSDDNIESTFRMDGYSEEMQWHDGDSKIVRATVKYRDGMLLRSKAVNRHDGKELDYSVGELKFEETVEFIDKSGAYWWEFKLLDVPSRGGESYTAKLYQQREEDKWFPERNEPRGCNPLGKNTIPFRIPDSIFQGSSRIIMVEVVYNDGETTESKSFDLNQALAEVANRRKDGTSEVGVIVGCVIGGVCIVVLVVGGVLCYKKKRLQF